MRKHLLLPSLLALSVALVGCASQPNASLEQARSNFATLQGDARANQLAALETQEAASRLEAADSAYRGNEGQEKVDQLAYLANQSVNVAVQTIRLRDAENQLKDASNQRAKALLDARDAQLSQREAELAAKNAQIAALEQQLQATQTERGTLVTFGDVLFDLDRAELKPAGVQNVMTLARFLQENPERQVIIEGYTDNTGTDDYNLDLSERRAISVKSELVKLGVDPGRIVTHGYGKRYPVSSNATDSGRAMNRRVEVTISNDALPVAPRSSQPLQ
jgi:outer membrane protein OmpA-like peptidoglycan-associated protein